MQKSCNIQYWLSLPVWHYYGKDEQSAWWKNIRQWVLKAPNWSLNVSAHVTYIMGHEKAK